MDADALAVVLGKEPEWAGQVRSLPGKRDALLSLLLYTAQAICLVKVDCEYVDLAGSQHVCARSHAERGVTTSRPIGYHRL
jgi:hypothetical protein